MERAKHILRFWSSKIQIFTVFEATATTGVVDYQLIHLKQLYNVFKAFSVLEKTILALVAIVFRVSLGCQFFT